MFLKRTRIKGTTYYRVVETYYNESGEPRQKGIKALGTLQDLITHKKMFDEHKCKE